MTYLHVSNDKHIYYQTADKIIICYHSLTQPLLNCDKGLLLTALSWGKKVILTPTTESILAMQLKFLMGQKIVLTCTCKESQFLPLTAETVSVCLD